MIDDEDLLSYVPDDWGVGTAASGGGPTRVIDWRYFGRGRRSTDLLTILGGRAEAPAAKPPAVRFAGDLGRINELGAAAPAVMPADNGGTFQS